MNAKAMDAYRGILMEIKFRVEAIDSVLNSEFPLRARIAEEFCYLQLRMICELIAIGCLIIHGELSSRKADLMKLYKADWIIKVLTGMHPKFFPNPLEQHDTTDDPPHWMYKECGFLTKYELIELYNKHAGDRLHRGSARNILKFDRNIDFVNIQKWRDKIVGLLNRHTIISPDEENICYFIMNDGKGNVHSALFHRIP
jgi:hypothetical protein